MALVQFKRINPNPPPTEAESREIAQRMLLYLLEHWDEREDLLEPEEPLPPESEFYENKCPECGGHYRYVEPEPGAITDKSDPAFMSMRVGHYAHCKRWLKWWKYKDTRNGVLYGHGTNGETI